MMFGRRKMTVLLAAALLCQAAPLAAQSPGSPSRPGLPAEELQRRLLWSQLEQDAAGGQWRRFSLLEAALIAAGCENPGERRQWLEAYAAHCEPILAAVRSNRDVANRRRIALEQLHDRILTGQYQQQCSDVRAALRDGDFNCLTATVLYLQLCRDAGLAPRAGCSPTHVVALFAGERGLLVQTTSRWGFESVAGADSQDEQIQPITDVALVGKVFYNQGVLLLEDARYDQAVDAFTWSLKLDPEDESASHNLLAALNNGALAAAADQRFDAARRFLTMAAEVDPEHPAIEANRQHVDYRCIEYLCQEERFDDALDVVHRGQQSRPLAPMYRHAAAVVYQRWAAHLLSTRRCSEGIQLLQVAALELPPETASQVQQYALQHARGEMREVVAKAIHGQPLDVQ